MQTYVAMRAALAVLFLASVVLFAYSGEQQVVSQGGVGDLACGFTDDFGTFLKNNGYTTQGFDRTDIKCAQYGGKAAAKDKLKKIPVIFIHGNSDIGFGRGSTDGYVSWQTGFTQLATYLTAQGYTKAELYTYTWGPANPNLASQNYHAKKYVLAARAFIEAVFKYTNSTQVNVIGHSMGVSLARKALKGGTAQDHTEGSYDVGAPLHDKVKTFVGLAGANLGLNACWGAQVMATCGTVDGFYPGLLASSGPSKYLAEINTNSQVEAGKVYTIWSKYDDLIQQECLVWGKVTCRIPGQAAEVVKTSVDWGHFAIRDKTGPDLIGWL